MIYTFNDDTTGVAVSIVGAADNIGEFEAFYRAILMPGTPSLYRDHGQPSISDMMLDERFRGLKKPPYVFEHENADQRAAFATQHGLKVVPDFFLRDKHGEMLAEMKTDPYLSDEADARTIEEIHGLDKHDQWDHRTEEEKAEDQKIREKYEKLRKAGKVSGDSFGPSKKDGSEVRVTDIRTTRNADGSISVDEVLAVKGLHDDNGIKKPAEPAEGEEGDGGVNDKGERLVPKGVQIVEQNEEVFPPRPWNDHAAEIAAMTEEERAKNWKTVKAKEFIYCGQYRGAQDGTIIYIAPRSYFKETGEMFPEPLNIGHLLPGDIKEKAPGIYVTTSRDWLNVSNHLTHIGMRENLALQLYINLL